MPKFCLEIEYHGSQFCGWQAQKKLDFPSIQETIEGVLAKILGHKVNLVAASRTDAGVHALGQVAHFKTHKAISCDKLKNSLNALLPSTIAVRRVRKVKEDFHSRFQARSKVYRYTILNRKERSVFLRDTSYHFPYPLNLKLMQKEAKAVVGTHDFKAFCGVTRKDNNYIRQVKRLKISKINDLFFFDIEADGFLNHMVRRIVGVLLEVGRGRLKPGSLKQILRSRDRRKAAFCVPARGLCLLKVKY